MRIKQVLVEKWILARKIRQEDGPIELLKSGFLFAIRPLYERNSFYLTENPLDLTKIQSNLAKHKPRIKDEELSFKVISSNQEADDLEAEGYKFRINPKTPYRRYFNNGLIAFCTFVGQELGAICWIILSQQTQRKCNSPPIKIDYSNHEALPRGAWSNPKYRGLGIFIYTADNRGLYLAQKGVRKLRSADNIRNKVAFSLSHAMGDTQYGKAVSLRILGWRSWKETYWKM